MNIESRYVRDVQVVQSLFERRGVQPQPIARAMAEVIVSCRQMGFRWMISQLIDVWNELEVIDKERAKLSFYPEGKGKE